MKKISFFSPRMIILPAVGLSAFFTGIFFALPAPHNNFARVDFDRISIIAEVADTPDAKAQGLSGRQSLPLRGGMLFVFDTPGPAGIWMKDMLIPIDIIWIAGGRVIDMKENALPPKKGTSIDALEIYRPITAVDFVLETASGFSRAHNVRIGDPVSIILPGDERVFTHVANIDNAELAAHTISFEQGEEFFIETFARYHTRGKDFQIGDLIESHSAYNKYAITYRSKNLTISGVMNVPNSSDSNTFPILILNHGLIPPAIYTTGRGSKREQDFFTRHGYITIHPDYRGHASSSPDTALHHDFYVGYSEDVGSLIDAIKRDPAPYMDTSRIGMWGHSMGGGIASRIMVLRPEIKAYVLFAPISADAEDNFYELTQEEIAWLHNTYGQKGAPIYRKISPIEYFNRVSAPIQLHHGTDDTAVPISFSEKMYNTLRQYGKNVEYFVYPGEKHEFIVDWPLAEDRALQFFDQYVKAE